MTTKYQCKTCKHFKDEEWGMQCYLDPDTYGFGLTQFMISFIDKRGCASHSECVEDFVSLAGKMEDVSRKDERDKVLDEAIAHIQKRIDGIFGVFRNETDEKITDFPYTMANGMGEAILILKKLKYGDKCYDGSQCKEGKSDACNLCYIPLQKGEKKNIL